MAPTRQHVDFSIMLRGGAVTCAALSLLAACSETDDAPAGPSGGSYHQTGGMAPSSAGGPAQGGRNASAGVGGGAGDVSAGGGCGGTPTCGTSGAPATSGSGGGVSGSSGGGHEANGGKPSGGTSGNDAAGTASGQAGASGSDSGGTSSWTAVYSTNFDLTEMPISENGSWQHSDPNQAAVRTAGGLAYGTQTGLESENGNYNDSSAFLTGFSANQRATAVIHRSAAAISGNLEAELLLRWSEGAEEVTPYGKTKSYGYEINLGQGNFGAFVQIGRWKRLNLFDSMKSGSPVSAMGVHDGDVFTAQIVGSTITVWLNDTLIASASDDTSWLPATGAPGIGFFRHDIPGPIDPTAHCFTSFTAESM